MILGLWLALWIGLVQLWLLRARGLGRLRGLTPVHVDVDGPRHTVPRGWGCRNCGSVAVATWWGWREQILGLVDQLLLLLLEITKAVLRAAPAIDEMNHRAHQIAEITTSLKGMATFLIAAEAIHQIIAGIFNIACDGRHDLQELIELLALGQIAAGEGRDPFLEQGSFILGLVGQAPMLSAAAHQAGVAIPQLQGIGTLASGQGSHAEGWFTVAVGTGSHAGGLGTIAYGGIDNLPPLSVPTNAQTVFGKFNIDQNTDSLFVIGDGLDDVNRHDILRVNSGSVQVTGSLFVNGYKVTGSVQKLNIAGYNRTNYTSPSVIGLAYFNPAEYPSFSNIAFTAVGMNMANVSGGLDLYNQNTSTLVAQLTWSGTSTLTTGSFETTPFSLPLTSTSYELHFSQSGGANGGTDYSTVGFVNFVLS